VLYELDASGSGTRVTNHWVQEDGADVFFMWVARNGGFQWVLPQDRAAGGVRLVSQARHFKSYPDGEISKVSGTPEAHCPMIAERLAE
jgi:hypothetical protein